MSNLWDFFSHEAGQDRRRWLDGKMRDAGNALSYFIPPDARPHASAAVELGGMFNPVNDIGDAMSAGRDGRWGDMVLSTGVAAAPAVAGKVAKAYNPRMADDVAEWLEEALMGLSVNPTRASLDTMAGDFIADETGAMGWFHGSPDGRDIRAAKGFEPRSKTVSRITDRQRYDELQEMMEAARLSGDEDTYLKLMDEAVGLRAETQIPAPLFASNERAVANTYADDTRAWDYQNADPEVFELDLEPDKVLTVNAAGDTFRGISEARVRKALEDSGIPKEQVDAAFDANVTRTRGGKITTDDLTGIVDGFGFDAVDVANVIDTYNGKGQRSTVRMLMDPTKARIPALQPQLTPAQEQAQDVLDLLSAGRADEVTDDMLAKADDLYLFENYDLPMDEASRMARAEEMGLGGGGWFRGSRGDVDVFRENPEGRVFSTFGDPEGYPVSRAGTFFSDSSAFANDYSATFGTGYSAYHPDGAVVGEYAIPRRVQDLPHPYDIKDWAEDVGDADAYDEMRWANGGWEMLDDEQGQAVKRYAAAQPRPVDAYEFYEAQPSIFDDAIENEGQTAVVFNPTNIRSRFARFDPRLKHLSNLSAAAAGIGLLAPAFYSEQGQ